MIQTIATRLRFVAQTVVKRIKQMTRPANGSGTSSLVMDLARSKHHLLVENALLRQQLIVLRRSQKRPKLSNWDRIKLICLARLTPNWKHALHIVQPDTLLRWHRDLFRFVWRRKSKPKGRRRRISQETIGLIRQMAAENLTWGAERIRGELFKLCISISKRTIQRYMDRNDNPSPTSQTWPTFLKNHAPHIWACDFVQVYDLFFRSLFVFVVIEHSSRRIVHSATTAHPTDAWVAQQLKEATPWGQGPRFLIRDNDGKFGNRFSAIATGTGIEEILTPVRAPNVNAVCERFVGSLRRECLDHMLVLNQKHLNVITRDYVEYYNKCRPHQGLAQNIPIPPDDPPVTGKVVALPVLGGLHHDYHRAA